MGRRVAGGGVGAARRAVGVGFDAAGAVRSRAGRLLGRGRTDNYPR